MHVKIPQMDIFTSCKGINHKYIAVEKGKQKMNKKGMKIKK